NWIGGWSAHAAVASFACGFARNWRRNALRHGGPSESRSPASVGKITACTFDMPRSILGIHPGLPWGSRSPRKTNAGTSLTTSAESVSEMSGTFHPAHHCTHGPGCKLTYCGKALASIASARGSTVCTSYAHKYDAYAAHGASGRYVSCSTAADAMVASIPLWVMAAGSNL